MNRFNIFNQIHKGLRAMLYNMALTIQHTDFSIEEEGKATLRKLKQVLELYAEHGQHEDSIVFPSVQEAAPTAITALEAEHEKDEQLVNDLLMQIRAYKNADAAEKASIGYAIHLAFQEFVAFNLEHMNKEERTINPLLWEQYTDDQIVGIQRNILRQVSQESNMYYTRWMLKGLNDSELSTWFQKVKATAPTEVWNGLWLLSIDELGYERTTALAPRPVLTSGIY